MPPPVTSKLNLGSSCLAQISGKDESTFPGIRRKRGPKLSLDNTRPFFKGKMTLEQGKGNSKPRCGWRYQAMKSQLMSRLTHSLALFPTTFQLIRTEP